MPIHALNHVGFSTPDLPRLVAFYRDVLGFGEVSSFSWPVGTTAADEGLELVDSSADVAILNAGNLYLEMFCFHTPEPAPQDPLRPVSDEGISVIGLEVTDADAAHRMLLDAGAVEESPPARLDDSVRAAVRDPDGNVLVLQQTLSTSAPRWSGRLSVVATPPVGPDDERRLVEPVAGVLGVNFVGLSTGDLDGHTAFYRDAGGLPEVDRGSWDETATGGTRAAHTLLNAGNVFLDLTRYEVPRGRSARGPRRINDHGLNHLCFDVTEIDELYETLGAAGMTSNRPPGLMPAGFTAMGYARDPFGNALEFVENRSPQAFLWCGHLQVHANPPA